MNDHLDDQQKIDERQTIWEARIGAFEPILGKTTDTVLHSAIPFQLGGSADVLQFSDFIDGITYVTAEMTGNNVGQLPTTLGNYELMICAKQALQQASELISKLACYTCEAELEPGETMDIGSFLSDSSIRALLFTHPRNEPVHFEFFGMRYGLLLCIGITAEELAFKQEHDSESLLALLRAYRIFPYTIPNRPSVPFPANHALF
jgi:hypothetical protein